MSINPDAPVPEGYMQRKPHARIALNMEGALAEARRMVERHTEEHLIPHLMAGYILAQINHTGSFVWCEAYQELTGCSDEYIAVEIFGG